MINAARWSVRSGIGRFIPQALVWLVLASPCASFVIIPPTLNPMAVRRASEMRMALSCPPPQTLSRTEPRIVFDVSLSKPMGIVLEEKPGRVFVATLAEGGSAAKARGLVLPGDRLLAVQGVSCEDDCLDAVMDRIMSIDSPSATLQFSRDASILAVCFDGGVPVQAQAGEPLRAIASRAGHKVNFDCQSGRCGTCEHRIGPAGPLAKYTRFCQMPLTPGSARTEGTSGPLHPLLEFFQSDRL